ncbi:putative cytochrome p450 monooxygenase [Phaeomoniella chlamydospora]|uniref:Putative cytochrome p450 monooxygenase n=1 Tax=Phaeomoniella chlamydospora TaxID=158046 RepID=A0A0G2H3Y1_PHACM|nr:putative cytochrome p450 monooxygenase [Phaeomoniella chlamydospora]
MQTTNRAIHAAHERCGPIVRLGPTELSINCVDEGIRTVYSGSFEKHDWYPRQFPNYGKEQMFSYVHNKPHGARKRMVSNIYSKTVLQSSAQVAENSKVLISNRLFPYLENAARTQTPVDVWSVNTGFTMDFMTVYLFGLSAGTKWALNERERNQMMQKWANRKPYEFYRSEIPKLSNWLQLLGIPIFPKFLDEANQAFEDLNLRLCDAAEAHLGPLANVGDDPVVYKQLKTQMIKSNEQRKTQDPEVGMQLLTASEQRLEIASEMLDHLGAGHETSAICLTYLQWELCRNPNWQKRLREELQTLSPAIAWPPKTEEEFDLPSPRSVDELKVLHAVLMETLRLHAPIPGNEPRITPMKRCTLAGYPNIPPNIRVQAQPYSLHRNPDVFPEPESWLPERWLLPSSSEQLKEMHRWFWAFGSGGRMCIGSNLAMQEMKLVTAAMYTNYTTSIIDDEGIEELDAYTTRPISNKLILGFSRV